MFGAVAAVAVILTAVAFVVLARRVADSPELQPDAERAPVGQHAPSALRAAAVALVVAHGGLLWFVRAPVSENGQFVGSGSIALVLVAVVGFIAWWLMHGGLLWRLLVPTLAAAAVVGALQQWPRDHAQWWTAAVLVGALLPASLLVGLRLVGNRRADAAWRGTAPAVLLAAALGTAVLFTSAVVVLAANRANGPQGVSALAASVGKAVGGEVELPDPAALRLTGPVRVVGGQVNREGAAVTIVKGVVSVGGLYSVRDGLATLVPTLVPKGVVKDGKVSILTLDDGALSLTDTCVTGEATAPRGAKTCVPLVSGEVLLGDDPLSVAAVSPTSRSTEPGEQVAARGVVASRCSTLLAVLLVLAGFPVDQGGQHGDHHLLATSQLVQRLSVLVESPAVLQLSLS